MPRLGWELSTIDEDRVERWPEAADGDCLTLTDLVAVDGNAGDSLQRFGNVGIRELADVLRGYGIDDYVGVALDVHRALEAGANAGDDNFLNIRRLAVAPGVRLGRSGLAVGDRCKCSERQRCHPAFAETVGVLLRYLHVFPLKKTLPALVPR